MQNNAGKSIKTMAAIVKVIGISISVIAGVILFSMAFDTRRGLNSTYALIAAVVAVGGSLISVAMAIMLDAFGSLVDNSYSIVELLRLNKQGSIDVVAEEGVDGCAVQQCEEASTASGEGSNTAMAMNEDRNSRMNVEVDKSDTDDSENNVLTWVGVAGVIIVIAMMIFALSI